MSRHLFAPVPAALIRDARVSATSLRLYSLLMRYANKDRICWPRQSRLAAELDCSRRTVERAVAELRANGWILTERRENGGVCKYTMLREAASVPCAPPDTDDGGVPTRMAGHIEREPLNESHREKNTSCSSPPPRSAAVRGNAKSARDREDALDPAKALALWDAPAEHPARRAPSGHSPMGLALAWRARMQEARIAGALDTNIKALARMFRVMLQEGVTPAQIRAITDLYAAASGMRNPAVAPWRHFLYQRHLLLSRVRDAERDRRLQSDPDAYRYVPPTPEQEAEAARAHAAAFEDYLARTA